MKARASADEKRAEESRKYRAEREKQETEVQLQKQQWLQSILTPQTIIMIIIVIASIFGVKGLDMMEATTGVPVQDAPPTGTIP